MTGPARAESGGTRICTNCWWRPATPGYATCTPCAYRPHVHRANAKWADLIAQVNASTTTNKKAA